MKLLFLTKYPPIEGGTSSRAFWLIKGLAEKGHQIFVITNANDVEASYRINFSKNYKNYLKNKNIKIFNVDSGSVPHYIPFTRPDVALLANKALQVIKMNEIDIVCSWYLLPYGLAGMITRQVTKIPHILKHAGSDLARLLQTPSLGSLLFEVIKSADLIATTKERKEGFTLSGIKKEKLFFDSNHTCVNKKFFKPKPKIDDPERFNHLFKKEPVISYFGKLNKSKGVFDLVEALSLVKPKFKLLIVSSDQNKDLDIFINKKKLKKKVVRIPFVAPWEMPYLIAKSRAVVMTERDFSIKRHVSVLVNEVMATGICLVLNKEVYLNNKKISKLKKNENVLVGDIKKPIKFSKILEKVLKDKEFTAKIGEKAYEVENKSKKYELYINNFLSACQQVLKKRK